MANKVYINPDSTVTWRDSGGTELMDLDTLGSGAGQNGALHDWGAAPRSSRYHLKFFCQFNVAPTAVGETVRIFIKEAGLTASEPPTNDDGTGDVALSTEDKTRNLLHVATLQTDELSTAAIMSIEVIFETAARHFGPVVFNAASQALHATAANNGLDITPIPDEIQ